MQLSFADRKIVRKMHFQSKNKFLLTVLILIKLICSVTSQLSDILTFNLEVIKVRYEVYPIRYQHSSILRVTLKLKNR
jgi:hypothetical protein